MSLEYVPGLPLLHPVVNHDNRGYWEGLRRHELRIQSCTNCGLRTHPPRPMCPRCLSTEREWVRSSGRGEVYSWVTFMYDKSGYPALKVPYAVVLVELEDHGMRILSNVVDVEPEEIHIGMPVEAVFTDVDEELTLVQFRKRDADDGVQSR